MEKITKKRSLKHNIVYLLLIGWVIPVLIMAGLLGTYVDRKAFEQASESALSTIEKADDVFALELDACEKASKNASYYSDIRKNYMQFLTDGDARHFENSVNDFLASEYKYNSVSKAAILYFPELDEYFYTYNNSASGSYKDIESYVKNSHDTVINLSEELGTKTMLIADSGAIYMVRNLMRSDFTPYAILTIEMNKASLEKIFESVWGYEKAVVLIDGEYMLGSSGMEDMIPIDEIRMGLNSDNSEFIRKKGHSYGAIRRKRYEKELDVIVELDNSILFQRVYTTWILFGIMFILMIPITTAFFHYFHKNVTRPMDELVRAFKEVGDKNHGYQIEKLAHTEEFFYMENSFNDMSYRIKEQFDRIVSEEIALRDAKIMALQSQINPHFLNNTFEIINWEARLNGNIKVSKMIEALSTMLEATMNRRGEHMHSLAEEMSYVDAYAYIISERLGDKFTYVKELDESLLAMKVPKLIIQPIVENAVEHGLSKVQAGHIKIRLFENGEFVNIEIINDGVLSEEDSAKIERLLIQTIDPDKERSLSLGIRNVNNRLKLIFGDDCGLTIENMDEESTISTIRIRHLPEQQ